MDWNARYESLDTPWDKGVHSPTLEGFIEEYPHIFPHKGKALIPGCGTGHDTQPLLKAGMQVTGLDISPLALQQAEQQYGKSEHLHWLNADLFKMPEQYLNQYHLIWEHTCYCAIPLHMRETYVDAVYQLIKPNQYFLGAFFIDTGEPPEIGPPHSTSRDDVFKNFSRKFKLIAEAQPTQCYPGREGKEWMMLWKKCLSTP